MAVAEEFTALEKNLLANGGAVTTVPRDPYCGRVQSGHDIKIDRRHLMSVRTVVSSALLASAVATAIASVASRRADDESGRRRGDGCWEAKVLRRRPQGAERLRRRPGHDLPGHLDR